jgi:hypothetical protein
MSEFMRSIAKALAKLELHKNIDDILAKAQLTPVESYELLLAIVIFRRQELLERGYETDVLHVDDNAKRIADVWKTKRT